MSRITVRSDVLSICKVMPEKRYCQDLHPAKIKSKSPIWTTFYTTMALRQK